VLLTTAAVATLGVYAAGMPIAAAIALGAIVAPPDAAAAAAVLGRFSLPRRTVSVLKGESLLNDAAALLIFTAAVAAVAEPDAFSGLVPQLLLAAPGGVLLGWITGRGYLVLSRWFAGALSALLFEFAATFGVWVLAERLHLSAILAVVVYAMVVARLGPERQLAHHRVRSYAVWETAVFLLNVVAFMLIGLQARAVVGRLDASATWKALGFAGLVLLTVVVVRIAWVFAYTTTVVARMRRRGEAPPTLAQRVVVSWCGMRGLVTLATGIALPADFPARDTIVLSAFVVVLGTLVLQGISLGPLLKLLSFKPDTSFDDDLARARLSLLDAADQALEGRGDETTARVRAEIEAQRELTRRGDHRSSATELGERKMESLVAKRRALADLRRRGDIDDDVFHALEQELDWQEIAASPPDRIEIAET
ncbi:MAG TPA: cation:proton antiporter, partial [Hansschlegelia sp.]